MEIVPTLPQNNTVSKAQVEQVQEEQKEYTYLETFLRTKGLSLFYYDPHTGEIKEVLIKYSDTIHIYKLPDRFIAIDWEAQKCSVDSKYVYFEALNMSSAIKRVSKFKQGQIKLFNLKRPSVEGIKLF